MTMTKDGAMTMCGRCGVWPADYDGECGDCIVDYCTHEEQRRERRTDWDRRTWKDYSYWVDCCIRCGAVQPVDEEIA